MRDYVFLGPGEAQQIRREHLLSLESRHYRTLLMLEEEPDNVELLRTAQDLTRRIEHHVKVLTEEIQPRQADSPDAPMETSQEARPLPLPE